MKTDTLIDALSKNVKRLPRHALPRRLAAGLLFGGVATLILVAVLLGFRADLVPAMRGSTFWMKWAYTISLGVGAIAMVARLARPEPVLLRRFWPVALPFAALLVLGVAELLHTPRTDWLSMWLGQSWTKCPWLVLLLSLPIFVGLLWSFRKLAPTRLRAAGAAAGLASGAWAATLYCLHCPEVSALFVVTWYTLGILLAAGLGALIGPRVLRW